MHSLTELLERADFVRHRHGPPAVVDCTPGNALGQRACCFSAWRWSSRSRTPDGRMLLCVASPVRCHALHGTWRTTTAQQVPLHCHPVPQSVMLAPRCGRLESLHGSRWQLRSALPGLAGLQMQTSVLWLLLRQWQHPCLAAAVQQSAAPAKRLSVLSRLHPSSAGAVWLCPQTLKERLRLAGASWQLSGN